LTLFSLPFYFLSLFKLFALSHLDVADKVKGALTREKGTLMSS
jgi:hypothetical protein